MFTAFWKESMINQLSILICRNRLAAEIPQVSCRVDGLLYSDCSHNFCNLDISVWRAPHKVPYDVAVLVCCEGVAEVQS